MKAKLYTSSYTPEVLAALSPESRFTATEHAYLTERSVPARFASRDSLIQWYLAIDAVKLPAVDFLANHLRQSGLRRILSLGAGFGVLESLLKERLPDDAVVVASEFDSYMVEQAHRLLPNITAVQFDMIRDDARRLAQWTPFDAAVFFGSAYVLDDPEFVSLLERLKTLGVRQIIDFHAGYMNWLGVLKSAVLRLPGVKVFRQPRGKFHGYSRSRAELRRIYRESACRIRTEVRVGPYSYVALLEY